MPTLTLESSGTGKRPPDDGLYRDTVAKLRHLDLLGRPIYVAIDDQGRELDRCVAVSRAETEKVLRWLWDAVYRARERPLQLLTPDADGKQ